MAKKKTKLSLPLIPLRGLMVFPHMVLHFDVGRPRSVAALEQTMMEDQKVLLVAQKDAEVDEPSMEDMCPVGTIALVKQVLNMPGDTIRVLVEGQERAKLSKILEEDPCWIAEAQLVEKTVIVGPETEALVRTTHELFEEYARTSMRVSGETLRSVRDVEKADQLADIIAANVLTRVEDRQAILEEIDVTQRLETLCGILSRETELARIEKQVQSRLKKQIDKNQKDYYLREQIKAIQEELGDKDATDVEDLRRRMNETPLNEEAREKVSRELDRLSRMAPGTPEIGVSRT
ncbi:MAG: LON peptidase substrate-binding domain-containing protein, partial [Clostridia bacterium]|nr:LON peptidase substrate-binding domain-containing protein [Clostridia bacterium]